jgi:tRNA pseudouridine55 synthase
MPVSGLLNLNKPAGATSRQAVDCVERLVRPARAGHAGTLDPLATGVLIVCIGPATRLIEYVQQMPKSYTGTFLLGRSSPTEDLEGDVTELSDPPVPSRGQILAACRSFCGQITQRPPAFSALKVAGRRAYDLARKGKPVDLAPRTVSVYRIEVVAYDYPRLTLEVECGAGTYIRSLGRDLAESLNTASVMAALERTAIGGFRIADAIRPAELTRDNWTQRLLPPFRAVERLPRIDLSAAEVGRIRNGLWIARPDIPPDAQELVACDPTGQLVGILGPCGSGQLKTVRNMPTEASA